MDGPLSSSSASVHRAVLEALGDHGYERMTIDAVARRTGPAPEALRDACDVTDLVITALSDVELFSAPPATGSLREDLRALLGSWRLPRSADERALAAVLSAAEWNGPLKEAVVRALDRPLARALGTVLNRAADRDVPPSALQTLNWVLRGLALERLRTGPRSACDLELLVDFLLAGLGHRPSVAEDAGSVPE